MDHIPPAPACSIATADPRVPLLAAEQPTAAATAPRSAVVGAYDRFVQVEHTALPSLHWLQGTLGSGMMAAGLMYGALGGGTAAEEGLARTAVVVGSHWYVGGVRDLLAAALQGGGHEAGAAAAAAIAAWAGLMAGTALVGSAFRPAQYSGLALYHAAVMAASACLRHSYQLAYRRDESSAGGRAQNRNLAWALGCAAVVACASIATGGTFWLTSRGSSSGALAAGAAGCHAMLGACRAMGLMQARAFARRPGANEAGATASV